MSKIYSPPSSLELCIKILHAVKILAEHIRNPLGQLENSEQRLIDNATSAIDEALQNFETLMNMWRSHLEGK